MAARIGVMRARAGRNMGAGCRLTSRSARWRSNGRRSTSKVQRAPSWRMHARPCRLISASCSNHSKFRGITMFAFIGNLRIRTKIFLGFGVLIGILAIMSGTAVISFTIVGNLFHHYEELANLATTTQKIERDLIELDQHVEKYAATGDHAEHDKVIELEKEIATLVEEAKHLV